MKQASWGCCVLLFNSSGEPAVHPEVSDSCAPGCSGTEFEVGRATSCEESVGATVNALLDYESSMKRFEFCIRRDLGRFSFPLCSTSSRSPSSWFWRGGHFHGGWNEKTEEIEKCQYILTLSDSSAKCIIFNRLFGSQPQSNVNVAGFRRWYVSFEMRIFLVALHKNALKNKWNT